MNKSITRHFIWRQCWAYTFIASLFSVFSLPVWAEPYTVEYNIPSPRSSQFYRPVTKDFDLLEVQFQRSNMPLQELIRGSTMRIKVVLPPGVSYAAISGESNDWQGPEIGTFPLMAAFDHDPGDFCATGGINCVSLEMLTPTTAALNRILYGNGSPRHPVRTEESEVYFVLYHPARAARHFNMVSLRIIMLVADKELYEQWRTQTPAEPNRAPQNSLPLVTQTTAENENLMFSSSNGNLISITDPDAEGTDDFTLNLSIESGTLSLHSLEGLNFTTGNGQDDASMELTGSLDAINNALNGLIFKPDTDFNGNATLRMTANDQGHNGSGGPLNSVSSLTIVVGSSGGTENQPPINQTPSPQSVVENGTLVFSQVAGNTLSASDANAGSTELEIALTANNGSITLASSNGLTYSVGDGANDANLVFRGTLSSINQALDGLRFNPTQNFVGGASIQFTTNDLGSGLGNALSDSDLVAINVISAGEPTPPPTQPTTEVQYIELTPFVIDAEGSFSTTTDAQISFSATLETLAGNVTPMQRDSAIISRDHFVNLKARIVPEEGHENIKMFSVMQWGNEIDGDLSNVRWFQKHALQRFGSLSGSTWGPWDVSSTLPLTGLQYYLSLSDVNRSASNNYTVQVSSGHLIPPDGMLGDQLSAFLFIGYEATVREQNTDVPFDNELFDEKIVQVFASAVGFTISDGEPLLVSTLELSLNDNELKLLNNPNSNGLVESCELDRENSPNPNAATLLRISDSSLCIVQLTRNAQVGDEVLINARGLADQNSQIGSEILSTTRIVVVD